MRLLGSKYAKNAFAAGAPPRTPLGRSALPRTPSWIWRPFRGGGWKRKGKKGEGKIKDRKGAEGGEGKERDRKKEKGKRGEVMAEEGEGP